MKQQRNRRQQQRYQMPQGFTQNFAGYGPIGWTRGDEFIEDELCQALARATTLDASGIQVEVQDGNVTLSGYAPTQQARNVASTIAMKILGLKQLNNHLEIGTSTGAGTPTPQPVAGAPGAGSRRT